MKSMTGYARCESRDRIVSVEIKGYNNRFLDIIVLAPPFLSAWEPSLRRYLTKRFRRGRIEIRLNVQESNRETLINVNEAMLLAYKTAFDRASELLGIEEPVNPDMLLSLVNVPGIFNPEQKYDEAHYRKILVPLIRAAVDHFDHERIREGHEIEVTLLLYLKVIEDSLRYIAAQSPEVEKNCSEIIRKRFAELCNSAGATLDENRLLTEIAILLSKYTIAEEIQRLETHMNEFQAEVARNEGSGKKLDFLCQEMNREINTIGSKSPLIVVSLAVVTMKDALENIREQLRNIE